MSTSVFAFMFIFIYGVVTYNRNSQFVVICVWCCDIYSPSTTHSSLPSFGDGCSIAELKPDEVGLWLQLLVINNNVNEHLIKYLIVTIIVHFIRLGITREFVSPSQDCPFTIFTW